jgi:hypothetical protein
MGTATGSCSLLPIVAAAVSSCSNRGQAAERVSMAQKRRVKRGPERQFSKERRTWKNQHEIGDGRPREESKVLFPWSKRRDPLLNALQDHVLF